MIVLPTAYFAPVSYYAALFHEDDIVIEACEHYVKQTLRNRCIIATNQGPQVLSINVQKGNRPQTPIREIYLSDHGNWMHQHLYSLATYYGNSPFYEFYIDEIKEVMQQGHDGTLFSLNEALRAKMCELIGFDPKIRYSEQWMGIDWAKGERLKASEKFCLNPYYQVSMCEGKKPFQADMSILDLLFNMGPESVLVLKNSWKQD